MQQEELQSADSGAQRHGTRAQEVFPDESVSSLPSPASRCVSAKSNNTPAPSSSTLCFAYVLQTCVVQSAVYRYDRCNGYGACGAAVARRSEPAVYAAPAVEQQHVFGLDEQESGISPDATLLCF
jgi:hypothetical protein